MQKYCIRTITEVEAALATTSPGDILIFSFHEDQVLFRFKVTKTGMQFVPFQPNEPFPELPPLPTKSPESMESPGPLESDKKIVLLN